MSAPPFNAAKVRGLTRRNSFSSSTTTPYNPEYGEAETKQRETGPIHQPSHHIVHGCINQIPITKVQQVGTSGNLTVDVLGIKMNSAINSILTVRYVLIVTFDNDLLNAPPSQTRSFIVKTSTELIFSYNTNGTGTWVNGTPTVTFINSVNGTRNIVTPQISTGVDGDTGTLRISMTAIGTGQIYINGVVDVMGNSSESVVSFS